MRYFLTDTCGFIYNKRVLEIHSISLSKDFLICMIGIWFEQLFELWSMLYFNPF